jgi:hypothetical protein
MFQAGAAPELVGLLLPRNEEAAGDKQSQSPLPGHQQHHNDRDDDPLVLKKATPLLGDHHDQLLQEPSAQGGCYSSLI